MRKPRRRAARSSRLCTRCIAPLYLHTGAVGMGLQPILQPKPLNRICRNLGCVPNLLLLPPLWLPPPWLLLLAAVTAHTVCRYRHLACAEQVMSSHGLF